jgi:hypothetical protein
VERSANARSTLLLSGIRLLLLLLPTLGLEGILREGRKNGLLIFYIFKV